MWRQAFYQFFFNRIYHGFTQVNSIIFHSKLFEYIERNCCLLLLGLHKKDLYRFCYHQSRSKSGFTPSQYNKRDSSFWKFLHFRNASTCPKKRWLVQSTSYWCNSKQTSHSHSGRHGGSRRCRTSPEGYGLGRRSNNLERYGEWLCLLLFCNLIIMLEAECYHPNTRVWPDFNSEILSQQPGRVSFRSLYFLMSQVNPIFFWKGHKIIANVENWVQSCVTFLGVICMQYHCEENLVSGSFRHDSASSSTVDLLGQLPRTAGNSWSLVTLTLLRIFTTLTWFNYFLSKNDPCIVLVK